MFSSMRIGARIGAALVFLSLVTATVIVLVNLGV